MKDSQARTANETLDVIVSGLVTWHETNDIPMSGTYRAQKDTTASPQRSRENERAKGLSLEDTSR